MSLEWLHKSLDFNKMGPLPPWNIAIGFFLVLLVSTPRQLKVRANVGSCSANNISHTHLVNFWRWISAAPNQSLEVVPAFLHSKRFPRIQLLHVTSRVFDSPASSAQNIGAQSTATPIVRPKCRRAVSSFWKSASKTNQAGNVYVWVADVTKPFTFSWVGHFGIFTSLTLWFWTKRRKKKAIVPLWDLVTGFFLSWLLIL